MAHRLKPIEASYISSCRNVLSLTEEIKSLTEKLTAFKRLAATEMNTVGVTHFRLRRYDRPFGWQKEANEFEVTLGRPSASRVNVRKLYTLLANHEITLDDFLDCVTAPSSVVADKLGDEILSIVTESYLKPLDLVVEPVKQGNSHAR